MEINEWIKFESNFDSKTCSFYCNVPFEEILVYDGNKVIYVQEHGWDDEEYYFKDGTGKILNVTHFMKMPKYKENI